MYGMSPFDSHKYPLNSTMRIINNHLRERQTGQITIEFPCMFRSKGNGLDDPM